MSSECSYDDYYEDDYSDYSESESESAPRPRRRSGKEKRKTKGKRSDEKVSKKGKKGRAEKKTRKDKVKNDKVKRSRRGERRTGGRKEGRRRRRPSPSPSYSPSYSESRSPSRERRPARATRALPPPPRRRLPDVRRGASPMPVEAPKWSPMRLPEGRPLTLAEACEAAGRGHTTGETAVDNDVRVLGPDEEPAKVEEFKSFDDAVEFPRELRGELKRAGFPAPSQIQAWTWPLGLKGKDVIGIAATGSGKTLAFLLPAFAQMTDEGHRAERDGPGLLVMSPTRELAQQTEVEASRFGKCLGFRCVAMYGGAPKHQQMMKYRQGVHTIVACPGRLNDFLEGGQVRLDAVRKLVLDEADRMLDMGFEPQIRKVLEKVPRKRHTMFFTATWPREVRSLAAEILSRPYKVMIGNRDELKGNQDITQQVRFVESPDKLREVDALLREAGLDARRAAGKALVFCSTKRMCEQLSNSLSRGGLPCTSIHGDKDQHQRDEALNGLKTGRYKVLVATDVAARGLDIKGVGLVVNYDPANCNEDYVHRIGRTARAGAKGFAITFLSSKDSHKARGIVEVMQRTDQDVDDKLREFAGMGGGGGGRRGGKGARHRGGRKHRGGGGGGGGFGGDFGEPDFRDRYEPQHGGGDPERYQPGQSCTPSRCGGSRSRSRSTPSRD